MNGPDFVNDPHDVSIVFKIEIFSVNNIFFFYEIFSGGTIYTRRGEESI